MKLEMFLKYPGILIPIGILLLIVSIILGIIAYKPPKKKFLSIEADKDEEDEIYEGSNNMSNKDIEITNTVVDSNEKIEVEKPILEEASIEEVEIKDIDSTSLVSDSMNSTVFEETKDSIELNDSNVLEIKNKEEFDTGTFKEEDFKEVNRFNNFEEESDLEDITYEISDDNIDNSEPILENVEIENIESKEEIKEEEERPIYGGNKPLQNIKLDFNEPKHDAYSNTDFQPTGNITVNIDNKKAEEKEEIEFL